MLKNFTYKQKLRLLILTGSVLLLLSYMLAFSKTWGSYKSYKDAEKKLNEVMSAPEKIAQMEGELKKLESIIGNSDTLNNVREKLLENTSVYCLSHSLALKEFSLPIVSVRNEYTIETNVIQMEGGFIPLLQFVNYLETKLKIGKVVSVSYRIKKNVLTHDETLCATIYVQNIKSK